MKKLAIILTAALFTAVLSYADAATATPVTDQVKKSSTPADNKAWKTQKRQSKKAAYATLTPGATLHAKKSATPKQIPKATPTPK